MVGIRLLNDASPCARTMLCNSYEGEQMTEKIVREAKENIEEIAENMVPSKSDFRRFLDIATHLGGGVVALSATIVSASMATKKFGLAYKDIKGS